MNTLLRLLKLIQAKKQYRKLVVPVAFFSVELIVALVLNWQLFGEYYAFNDSLTGQQASIHNPLIIIQPVHSDRLTSPYGSALSEEMPVVHFYSQKYMVKALCFLASLMFAYIGMVIASLWVRRTLKNSNPDIIWWQWPVACMGAHMLFYLFANSDMVGTF